MSLKILTIQSSGLNLSNVLIVEDEAVTRLALTVLLEHQGAIVVSVGSIQEGIETVRSGFEPEVLLSNIRLPDGNGARVLESIRQQQANLKRQAVAIALTGEVIDLIQKDSESAGFDVYLSKPYDAETLLRTIEQLIDMPPNNR